jgi:hypothetical protein
MSETSSERILGSLSPEHRARLKQIADDESVTDQVWVERVIMQRSAEQTDDAAQRAEAAETAAVRPDAPHKSHAKTHTGPAQAAHPDHPPQPAAAARQATERTIQREESHGAQREGDVHADQVSTTVEHEQETIETRTHGAQAAKAHRPAHTTTPVAGGKDELARGEDERDVLIEARTEIRHDDRGGADTVHTSHRRTGRREDGRLEDGRLGGRRVDGGRVESEMSAYHIRLAERAAAVEDVPLTIWLEQAILAHVRRPRGEAVGPGLGFSQTIVEPAAQPQPVSPPPVPPAPAPQPAPQPAPVTPIISETITGGRGIDLLIALILGAVLVLIILLILPWLGVGRSVSSAATPIQVSATATSNPAPTSTAPSTATSAATSQATTPTASSSPTPPPASGANVTVTTLINGASPADGASWTRRVHTRSYDTREIMSERAQGFRPARPSGGCGCYGAAVLDRLPPPAS